MTLCCGVSKGYSLPGEAVKSMKKIKSDMQNHIFSYGLKHCYTRACEALVTPSTTACYARRLILFPFLKLSLTAEMDVVKFHYLLFL